MSIIQRKKTWFYRGCTIVGATIFLSVAFRFLFAPTPQRLHWNRGRGVILNCGQSIFQQCSRDTPSQVTGFYLANLEDVEQLEMLITAAFPKVGSQRYSSPYPISSYRMQYVGFYQAGRRKIYINAYTHLLSEKQDWKATPINVCDGSTSYFGMVYDPATKTFDQLEFNGPGISP